MKMNHSNHLLEHLENCTRIEAKCIELVYEFLICQGLQKTADIFKEEISSTLFSLPPNLPLKKERILKDDAPILLNLLENEDHTSFFMNWESLIPLKIRELPDYKKLTIHLYTYFATLPFREEFKGNRELETNPITFIAKETSNGIKKLEKIREEHNQDFAEQKINNLSGTFVVEKPCQNNIPNIDKILSDGFKSSNETEDCASKEFETDSLEDESETKDICLGAFTIDYPLTAMQMFKNFLLDHGSEFTKEVEFLPYFALPFIENPKNHPTFLKVFEDEWLTNLKLNLMQFLVQYSCGNVVLPELAKICKTLQIDKTVNDTVEKSVSEDNSKTFKEVKRKMHKLKRDHQKLVGVASELASALEKSVQGEAVELKSTLLNCISIFPDLFPATIASHHIKWNSSNKNVYYMKKQILHSHLDAQKIKHDLYQGGVKTQLLLLQALRWHLTQSESEEREQLVLWLSRQDVLQLRNGLIGEFLLPVNTPHPLQQSVVRLLNAIASLSCGRDYISSSDITVNLLFEVIKSETLDPISEDMVIATVQKLSLRRHLCELMIGKGLIECVLGKLKSAYMKKYTFEYSTSLLMNLSLHVPPSYWDKHQNVSLVLINLLLKSPPQAKEFICGVLCCALRNDNVNRICKSEGMGIKLDDYYEKHKEDLVIGKQLETLLKLHHREILPTSLRLDQYCDDELEDPDEFDGEIDNNDLVKGSVCGEELLEKYYCLLFPSPGIVGRHNEKFHKFILRPSSPGSKLPSWATQK